MERAEGILNVMKQGGINPNSESYSLLICGYIKNGNLKRAADLLKECELREYLFSDKDYFDIMYTFGKYGHEKEMDEVSCLWQICIILFIFPSLQLVN